MKIFCFYSQSHNPLAEKWLASARVDPDLIPYTVPIGAHGNGDYHDGEHWRDVIRLCSELLLGALAYSVEANEIIGVTGADVVFLRPFVREISLLMGQIQRPVATYDDDGNLIEHVEYDILMQQERPDADLWNPDVAFYRNSLELRQALSNYLSSLDQWDGHLVDQNRLMREAFASLRVGLLPPRYANTSLGPCPDMVLYHANCLPPPDSVSKKLEALDGLSEKVA